MIPLVFPVSKLQRNHKEVLTQATDRPVFITEHGSIEYVIQSKEAYERQEQENTLWNQLAESSLDESWHEKDSIYESYV